MYTILTGSAARRKPANRPAARPRREQVSADLFSRPGRRAGLFAGSALAADPAQDRVHPKNTEPLFRQHHQGLRGRLQGAGLRIHHRWPGDAGGEPRQIPSSPPQIQRGVNVIAISPNSPDALNQIFDRGAVARVQRSSSSTPTCRGQRGASRRRHPAGPTSPRPVSPVELMGSMIATRRRSRSVATTDAPDQNVWIADMKKALEGHPKYKT